MQTAIVTGAGSGIGKAIALRLAAEGFDIALIGRRESLLEQAAAEVRALGRRALPIVADVSKHKAVDQMVLQTQREFGRIDALINNAGYAPLLPTADLSVEEWHRIMDTNLSSVFYACRAVFPIMKTQYAEAINAGTPRTQALGGTIISISSMAARDPFPGLGAYGVAKLGVNLLTTVLAREGKPHGIKAMAVAPAGVETAMFRQLMTPEQMPTDKILQPDDVAATVTDCITGSLKHCSGETIYVHQSPA